MTRTVFHMLLGVLLWALFAYYWHLVMQRPITPHAERALIFVACIVAGITVFQMAWIFHNVRIAGRNQRRVARREDATVSKIDFLGRTFIAQSEEALRRAPYIEVHVVEVADRDQAAGHKLFRIADVEPDSR